jgi:CubicO group peptidase (beta-lactamase class C family)
VTLAHLLTHTAGFEDRAFGFYAHSPAALTALQTFLAGHLPARVYPPGKVTAYSNYGIALAGHIVARVAGMPFEHYVEDHILKPLGMQHSTFRQPLPAKLAAGLATGYRGSDGYHGYGWYQARPAAALRASAADMARFMLAQLQQGRSGKARILKPQTVAAMQQRQFSNDPAVSGLTYGFQELRRAGRRILWHPGDTLFYTAALYLLPDEGLGLFIAHNRAGTRPLQFDVLDTVLAALPARWPAPATVGAGSAAVEVPDGSYRSTRSSVLGLERLISPFRTVRVRTVAPGRLQITGLAMAPDGLWIEQAPGVYHDGGGEEVVVFRADEDGTQWLFEGNLPAAAYERLPWHAAPAVQGTLLAGCMLVFCAGLVVRPPRDRRRQPRVIAPRTLPVRLSRPVTGALCVTNLAFLAGVGLILSRGHQLLFGIPAWARAILLLPLASAVLTAATAVLTLIAWRRGYWSARDRWHMALITLAALLFLVLLRYWRLL